MTDDDTRSTVPVSARWLARLALLAALGMIVILLIGGLRSIAVLLCAIAGIAISLAGGWWFLSNRGTRRWLGAAIALAAPIAALIIFAARDVLWAVVVVVVLLAVFVATARAALHRARTSKRPEPPAEPAPVAQRPFIIMNPRSGGGKVRRFDLDSKAAALGAEVSLLEGPAHIDVAELAGLAVTDGADLLGVAGGDGTQALVAGIAAEHGLPFLVISAGTRNHFAMDLGLDREHPDTGLDALRDGVELCIDLGCINGRTFVNNASFGAYAEVVQSPAYRDDKRGTTLQLLPDLLTRRGGPRLVVRVDGGPPIESPQAVLVSNNPYDVGDPAGLGRRARLDTGELGVIAVTVANAAQAADLLRGRHGRGLARLTATEVVVDADVEEIPVGIDGEAVLMRTPVRCTIRPRALRVRVPRVRPGATEPLPPIEASVLLRHAVGLSA
jgi:diacylglycerol kinase family enzyme